MSDCIKTRHMVVEQHWCDASVVSVKTGLDQSFDVLNAWHLLLAWLKRTVYRPFQSVCLLIATPVLVLVLLRWKMPSKEEGKEGCLSLCHSITR